MKAVVIHAYGGPEQLKFEDFPDPHLGADDVLIRVVATSVNPFDLKIRSGALKEVVPLTFPSVLGLDVSGTVERVGPEVKAFTAGDQVFAHASQTYAQFCVVKSSELAKVPPGMNAINVAALPTVTTTGAQLADHALRERSSAVILVTGAVGNVGRSAVCEAKRRGAKVIAGVLKRQVDESQKIGADRIVSLDDDATVQLLEPLDAVADTIAGPVANKLLAKIKNGGVFASTVAVPSEAGRFTRVHFEYMQVEPDTAALLRMAEAVKSGRLTIPLGQQFALQDAFQAHAAAERHDPGKILLVA